MREGSKDNGIKAIDGEFLQIMKQSEYDIVEQLKKTPVRILILSLILSSEAHRKGVFWIPASRTNENGGSMDRQRSDRWSWRRTQGNSRYDNIEAMEKSVVNLAGRGTSAKNKLSKMRETKNAQLFDRPRTIRQFDSFVICLGRKGWEV